MYQLINEQLAVKCGVNAALIATTIWDSPSFSDGEPLFSHNDRCWMRSSYRRCDTAFGSFNHQGNT